MKAGEILLLGDLNIDSVWPVQVLPGPGRDAFVEEVRSGLGGAVVNTAIVLSRLGQQTGLIAAVGEDAWARQAREALSLTSVNLAQLKSKPGAGTGLIFLAVTPDGERTMYACRGANDLLAPGDIDAIAIKNATLLHLTGYAFLKAPQRDAAWHALRIAKDAGIPVSLDTALEPAYMDPDGLKRLLSGLELCITGLEEMDALFGVSKPEEAAQQLHRAGVRIAAVKLGSKGSYISDGTDRFFCPVFPVKVMDTTGAGDSFGAGLLAGYVNGLGLRASALLGSALGALATGVLGAGLALPGWEQTQEFLQNAVKPLDIEWQMVARKISELFPIK